MEVWLVGCLTCGEGLSALVAAGPPSFSPSFRNDLRFHRRETPLGARKADMLFAYTSFWNTILRVVSLLCS